MRASAYLLIMFGISCALIGGSVARGDVTFSGTSASIFQTPSPDSGSGTVYSGVGTNDITSGQALSGSYPNELKMDPLAFSSISANTAFAVSSLTYTNGDTAVGTTPTDFPVTITLNFTDPAGLSQPFSFTYNLDVTPNNASPLSNPLNDDILTVPVAFAPETFVDSDDGQTYTLQLLGFSSDGGMTITSQFVLPEEATTQSTLYAQITAPPAPSGVPLPSSASLGFVLLGILGACGVWRVVRVPQKA